jgi:sulfate transport system ATP-binding protein
MTLSIRNIEKRFGRFQALRDVSLDAPEGEFVALLGPSGSGKTTLLRVIAGLEMPDHGAIQFRGADLLAVPVRRRRIGMVFQHYALFRHMTVAENIAFGMKARRGRDKPNSKAIAAKVSELLTTVQLEDLGRRFPSQLSGGQRQRVALARALAIEPQILLLDEPFGALDAKVRRELRAWLRELHARTGLTTIFVTHDQEEALELADRVAVLRDGAVEQVGPPGDLYHDPRTPFVFEFLGPSVRAPAQLQDGAAMIAGVRTPVLGAAPASGPVMAYMRPWDVQVAMGDGPGLKAEVRGLFLAGPQPRVDVALAQGGNCDAPLPVDLVGKVHPGDLVRLVPLRARVWPLPGGG